MFGKLKYTKDLCLSSLKDWSFANGGKLFNRDINLVTHAWYSTTVTSLDFFMKYCM